MYLRFFHFRIEIPSILENPVAKEIAKKHNKSVAQVLLRHIIQRGIVAIPKSTNPERLRQNLDIFNFELDSADMEKLNGLDQGGAGRLLDFGLFKGYVLCKLHKFALVIQSEFCLCCELIKRPKQ